MAAPAGVPKARSISRMAASPQGVRGQATPLTTGSVAPLIGTLTRLCTSDRLWISAVRALGYSMT